MITPKLTIKVIIFITLVGLVATPFLGALTVAIVVGLLASRPFLNTGIFTRIASATLLTGTLGAIILQLSTMLDVRLPFEGVYVFLLLLACACAIYGKDSIDLRTSIVDVSGLVVGVGVFLLLTLPLFGASNSKMLEYLVPGEDNGSHFQMYRYVLTNQKYAYNNQKEHAGIRPTLLSYAQGSHGVLATLTAPIAQDASPNGQLKVYAWSAAATFAMVFWLSYVIMASGLNAVKDRRLAAIVSGALLLAFVAIAPLGIMLPVYTYGYFPQFFAYLGLVFLVIVVMSVSKSRPTRGIFLIECILLLVGFYAVFAAWYLLAPVALLPLLGYAWERREVILRHKWDVLVVILVASIIFLHLAYIFLAKSSGAGHILTTGGVEKMNWRVLLVALPALMMLLPMIRNKQWRLLGLTCSLLAAAGMTSLIGYYHLRRLGHFDYYFYKTLFTVAFIATLFYGYMSIIWIGGVLAGTKLNKGWVNTAAMPILGLMMIGLAALAFSPPKYFGEFVETKYALAQYGSNRVLDIFTDESIFNKYSDVITLNSCNPYTNFTGTIWAGSYFLPYNVTRQKFENDLLSRSPELSQPNSDFVRDLINYASAQARPVAVYVSDDCYGHSLVGQLSTIQNIKLVMSR